MISKNTFGVQFIIRVNKIKDGKVPIYVRITVDSQRVEMSLKRWIQPIEWNAAKGLARGSRKEITALNTYLEQIRARLVECYQEIQLKKKLITAKGIKSLFLGEDDKQFTLTKLVTYHNETMKTVLAVGTLKNYSTTEKYILEFLKTKKGTSDIYLSEINYQFVIDFEMFLRNHKPVDHQKPMQNNGVMKHLERLRKMLTLAIKMELMIKDPFSKYALRFDKVERECLTESELSAIENKKFSIERLDITKDLFVFSCYTGLAYIDVMKLNVDKVNIGIDGQYWITTKREKTKNPVRVPILPKAWEIIQKYQDHPKVIAYGTLLPHLSNQKLNGYLKEVADLCSIKKNITFHLARHTFATTITLLNGVPIETVSKMLGHTKISTTQIYAKVVEQKVSQDMMKLQEKLSVIEFNKKSVNS
ncbi:site-specific integrase [Flavobacterium sp.]|uniref:site-specific integrase n=1 Tax=Flavobacterium sp. TaxID=239 RepID=UPI003752F938